MKNLTRGRRFVGVCAGAGAMLLLIAGAATGSSPAQTFTVAVAPNILTAGGPAVAVGSFANSGPAIDHVAITLTFPFAVNVLGNRCSSLPRLTKTVVCLLGPVAQGGTANAAIPFTAPATTGPFPLKGIAAFIGTGSGHPTAGLLSASATGTVFASTDAAHKGTCTNAPNSSTTATASSHVVALDTVPQPSDPTLQLLGCTPVGVAVDPPPAGLHTETLSVFVPQLVAAAKVTLTFPDEFLPGGFDADGHHTLPGLQEFSDASVPLGFVVSCSSNTATTIPAGHDACILSINPDDHDHDTDAGTIDLLVQGSGLADPRFAG